MEVAYLLPWKNALVGEIEAAGVAVHCLEGAGRTKATWPLRLRSLVKERDYSIVHTHMPYPAAVARVVLPRRRLPLVHTEHNVWSRYRPLTRAANAVTLARNAAVIAVSDAVAESMIRPVLLPWADWPPIRVIHHGIDVARVRRGDESRQAAREALGVAPEDFVVGTVGNLTAKKDHRTLLEAVALLAPGHERLRAVIIGDGPLKDELHSGAASLGLGERVTFAGSRPDVPDLLPGFDVFALSSQFEGFPLALIEAMASALPCVATRAGGTPELIRDRQNGLLVPPGTPAPLAHAINELASNPGLRESLGRQAAEDSLKYSLREAVDGLQRIYSEVLAAQ